MTKGEKISAGQKANKAKRDAKEAYHRELLELMIMALQTILKDESLPTESRLRAIEILNALRKELHI